MKRLLSFLCPLTLFLFACTNEKPKPNPLLFPDPTALFVTDSLKYLLPILDSVLANDQKYRYGMNLGSTEERDEKMQQFNRHAKEIRATDQKDLEVVKAIIAKHGWLGYKDIGMK